MSETVYVAGYVLALLVIVFACVLTIVAILGCSAMALWAWRLLKDEWGRG